MKLLKTIPENKKPEFLWEALDLYRYHYAMSNTIIALILTGVIIFFSFPSFATFYISVAVILCSILLFIVNLFRFIYFAKKWTVYKPKR